MDFLAARLKGKGAYGKVTTQDDSVHPNGAPTSFSITEDDRGADDKELSMCATLARPLSLNLCAATTSMHAPT
jgi:hypothetical protein